MSRFAPFAWHEAKDVRLKADRDVGFEDCYASLWRVPDGRTTIGLQSWLAVLDDFRNWLISEA
jgi:hypothetical protein